MEFLLHTLLNLGEVGEHREIASYIPEEEYFPRTCMNIAQYKSIPYLRLLRATDFKRPFCLNPGPSRPATNGLMSQYQVYLNILTLNTF